MNNHFKQPTKNDNEVAAQLINKFFGNMNASLIEAGITDAKEAFDQARIILRGTQAKTNKEENTEESENMPQSVQKIVAK